MRQSDKEDEYSFFESMKDHPIALPIAPVKVNEKELVEQVIGTLEPATFQLCCSLSLG
jgi:hypothetical protein